MDWEMRLKKHLSECIQIDSRKYKAVDDKWYIDIGPEGGGYSTVNSYGPFDTKELADQYIESNLKNMGYFFIDASGIKPIPKNSKK